MIMSSVGVIGILSYVLGSVPFSIILGRLWKGIDVRDYGSKNAGFTNVYRVVGPLPAVLVLILDVAKGMAAVLLLTRISFDPVPLNPIDLKIMAAVCVILGHVFPVFAGFKGGKGIAAGLGALLSIIPFEVAAALATFVLIVALTRYVSLGSLSATTLVFLALLFERYYLGKEVSSRLILATLFLTAFIFFNHRGNIKRLLAGTENKLGQKARAEG
jgi:glycerol-3-phosphate acyltransferase PlsY